MTDKQKLAIKRLELNKNTEIYVDYKTKEKTDDIQIVLDLLKEKDNQIDLMAETISNYDLDIPIIRKQQKKEYCEFMKSDEDCCWKTDTDCKECIKEFYERESKRWENK